MVWCETEWNETFHNHTSFTIGIALGSQGARPPIAISAMIKMWQKSLVLFTFGFFQHLRVQQKLTRILPTRGPGPP